MRATQAPGCGKRDCSPAAYRFKARLRHVHWQFPEEAASFAVLPERYARAPMSVSAYIVDVADLNAARWNCNDRTSRNSRILCI
jgi:hypothetical protein